MTSTAQLSIYEALRKGPTGLTVLPGGNPEYSVFDRRNRPILQRQILSGDIDSDTLLPDLLDYVGTNYYNLFCNLGTGEHAASPVCRRGNPEYARRQAVKRDRLKKILRDSPVSYTSNGSTFSHLFFLTLTIDRRVMSRDEANRFITVDGKGVSRFLARFEKQLDGGYSRVTVKESTKSGYPAVHIILYLDRALKVRYHRKSGSYRPDPSDPYTRKILGSLKNLDDWRSASPLWENGFVDFYAFTEDSMGVKGRSNFVNYITKYITKSLDLRKVEGIEGCTRVSELPEKYRTVVWTILNNLIWNSQIWVVSKAFKDRLRQLEDEERRERAPSGWMYVDTVHRDSQALRDWIGGPFSVSTSGAIRKVQPSPTRRSPSGILHTGTVERSFPHPAPLIPWRQGPEAPCASPAGPRRPPPAGGGARHPLRGAAQRRPNGPERSDGP